jgi:hypothetical protein
MGAVAGLIGSVAGIAGGAMKMSGERERMQKQAEAQAKEASQEAWNNMIESYQYAIQAHETNTAMTQNLTNVAANIRAVRVTGTEATSPTGQAVINRTLYLGNQDIRRKVQDLQLEAAMHMEAFRWYSQVASEA